MSKLTDSTLILFGLNADEYSVHGGATKADLSIFEEKRTGRRTKTLCVEKTGDRFIISAKNSVTDTFLKQQASSDQNSSSTVLSGQALQDYIEQDKLAGEALNSQEPRTL